MKTKVYNKITCRTYSDRRNSLDIPKMYITKLGKITLSNALITKLNSDYVEIVETAENRFFIRKSSKETGFVLRNDNKSKYRAFNSSGLYRIINEALKPPASKFVKSASLAVDVDSGEEMFEINIKEPLYIVHEYDPDSAKKL